MNNFGVIELAGPKTAATPGWAYVPDAGPVHHGPATGRKRAAARGQGLSFSDQSAREEARVRRELEGLDKEGSGRDTIPIPARGRAQGKHTPNVRKILQSNKTFANHLDDFEALQSLEGSTPANASTPREPPTKQGAAARRKASSRASSATGRSTPKPLAREGTATERPPVLAPLEKGDVKMEDADADADAEGTGDTGDMEGRRPGVKLPEGAGDAEMLLQSRVPEMPSDAELRALLAGPPLSYSQARGTWGEEDMRYPVRVFCSICGYWGKVKCVKCGTRVCALECMESHREECITRYGL